MLHGVTPHGLVYITTTLFPGTECRGRTSSTELSYIGISLSSALSPTYVYLRPLPAQVESSSLISSGQKLRTSAIASPPRSADDVPVVGCQEVALSYRKSASLACFLPEGHAINKRAARLRVYYSLPGACCTSLPSHRLLTVNYCHYRKPVSQCERP
jgi:hypothetical protein